MSVIFESIPQFIASAFDVVQGLGQGIANNAGNLMPKIVELVTKIVSTITDKPSDIIATGIKLVEQLAVGLIKGIPQLIANLPEIIISIVTGLGKLVYKIGEVGLDLVKGLWEGIKNAKDWLINKIKEWCGGILDGIKAFFGIHSPSREMAKIGVNLDKGLAQGITEAAGLVQNSANTLSGLVEKEIAGLQDKIANTTDQALKDSLNSQLQTVQNFKTELDAAVKEIVNAQDKMAGKLQDYGALFTKVKDGMGNETLELGDLQADIDQINAYGKALEDLKDLGVSESLMAEIQGMGIDDAMAYTSKLLAMTDEEYQTYLAMWEEKQQAAKEVATRFYQDDLAALQSEYVDKIPQELSGVKDEMREIGLLSAQGLANGFRSQGQYIKDTFVSVLESALAAARKSMDIHSPSKRWAEIGKYMAQGLGVGFTSQMQNVSKQIINSIPSPTVGTSYTTVAKIGESVVNAVAGSGMGGVPNNQPIVVQVNLDGKQIATATFDPLKQVAKQRGVAFG